VWRHYQHSEGDVGGWSWKKGASEALKEEPGSPLGQTSANTFPEVGSDEEEAEFTDGGPSLSTKGKRSCEKEEEEEEEEEETISAPPAPRVSQAKQTLPGAAAHGPDADDTTGRSPSCLSFTFAHMQCSVPGDRRPTGMHGKDGEQEAAQARGLVQTYVPLIV
jgi:hypothetical protein